MRRNLDLTALRSFVAVADTGGVTRAAGVLHLTQSAVSMQLKRLEEMLGAQLFDRANRSLHLTADGEYLLSYARRMLALNDEVVTRLTDPGHEGEIVLGVPHDIVYPAIPDVLRRFNAAYPRMRVNLVSSFTVQLKEMFTQGRAQVILTTEEAPDAGGETLGKLPLVWVGAREGRAWRERPLRLAFEYRCMFRAPVQESLDAAGIPWEMGVESETTRAVEASISADLAVYAQLQGTCSSHMAEIQHGGALPELPSRCINLYTVEGVAEGASHGPIAALGDLIRGRFACALRRDHDFSRGAAAA
jgi:DNA-binding transcriptional LysR family regulator